MLREEALKKESWAVPASLKSINTAVVRIELVLSVFCGSVLLSLPLAVTDYILSQVAPDGYTSFKTAASFPVLLLRCLGKCLNNIVVQIGEFSLIPLCFDLFVLAESGLRGYVD